MADRGKGMKRCRLERETVFLLSAEIFPVIEMSLLEDEQCIQGQVGTHQNPSDSLNIRFVEQ